jgi:hypothetical protein
MMLDELPQAIEKLRRPLWASVATNVMLVATLLGGTAAGVRGFTNGVSWVNEQASLIAANGRAVEQERVKADALHADIVSLDGRVNDLRAKVFELHNESLLVEHDLKAQLDAAAQLSKYNTERAAQAPLPQGPRR